MTRHALAVALSLAASSAALPSAAAPLLGRDALSGPSPGATADSPAAQEFRAGVQAELKGDMAQARTRFEAALKLVVQGEMGDATAARVSLQRALDLDPRLPQADEARRLLKSLAS